jgi:hypothetical protein
LKAFSYDVPPRLILLFIGLTFEADPSPISLIYIKVFGIFGVGTPPCLLDIIMDLEELLSIDLLTKLLG